MLTVERVGIILAALGIALSIAGHVDQYGAFLPRQLFHDLYANAGSELISIAVTVLIIDTLNRHRARQTERAELLREMGSRDNSTALRATDAIRAAGWLADGSLQRVDLKYANLETANLDGADLRGAYLSFARLVDADLRHTDLTDAILREADLSGALLINADLTGAKLLNANLEGANLHGASLHGANLAGANLFRARGLSDDVLEQAASLEGTTLPNGSVYTGSNSDRSSAEMNAT